MRGMSYSTSQHSTTDYPSIISLLYYQLLKHCNSWPRYLKFDLLSLKKSSVILLCLDRSWGQLIGLAGDPVFNKFHTLPHFSIYKLTTGGGASHVHWDDIIFQTGKANCWDQGVFPLDERPFSTREDPRTCKAYTQTQESLHHHERPNAYSTPTKRQKDCPRGVYYGEIDLARVIWSGEADVILEFWHNKRIIFHKLF